MTQRSAKRAEPAVKIVDGEDRAERMDPTVLEELVGFNLRRAYSVQLQRFASVFRPLKIRPVQYSILTLIHHNPKIGQSELGKALDIKRANIVTLLDELGQRGLLLRHRDSNDRRSLVLDLTPSGRRLTAKLLDLHERLEEDLARSLGARDKERLLALLKKFRGLNPQPELGLEREGSRR